jgi:tetratricopeptide (TPR) repeat protein
VFAGSGDELIRQGEAQLKAGQIEEAIETLRQAVAADPGSSLAYTRLGGAQVLHQEYDPGIESFKQAIVLDGKNADAFVGMAIAYLHSSRYPLARAALEEAKRIDPSKQAKVDELIAWIDERSMEGAH